MSLNRPVTDEDILSGFASLHQAMATGFDQVRAEMALGLQQVRTELGTEIHGVRNDISRLEQRMLRRFDDVDEKLDRHEKRISALEAAANR